MTSFMTCTLMGFAINLSENKPHNKYKIEIKMCFKNLLGIYLNNSFIFREILKVFSTEFPQTPLPSFSYY